MADVSKIFKPRRGKASTMKGTKASTILAAGELFVEVPDTGVGTGVGKLKMGDGTTTYANLPYLMGDTANDKIAFTTNTATTVATALNSAVSGNKLNVILAALKQAISLNNTAITKLNDDLSDYSKSNHNHDDRYYTDTEIDNKITTLQNSFQDGCDLIVDAVTAKGQTPASNSPTDIALAIENLAVGQGNCYLINDPSELAFEYISAQNCNNFTITEWTFYIQSSTYGNATAYIQSEEYIDFSNYNNLNFVWHAGMIEGSFSANVVFYFVSESGEEIYINNYGAVLNLGSADINIDISEYSGKYKIKLGLYCLGSVVGYTNYACGYYINKFMLY